jgi:hypothetical protein
MRPWSVPLEALPEFQHASPTGGFIVDEWRGPEALVPGAVVEVAGQWRAVRAVACGIGYHPTGGGWRVSSTGPLVWTYGDPAPHVARSGFRTRLDMRVDGGTSPLRPVPVGAEVLVYDRHGTWLAEVTAADGDRLTYVGDDREHHGQLSDVAEVVHVHASNGTPYCATCGTRTGEAADPAG